MKNLVETLKRFNAKERYYLAAMALGNPNFKLGKDFRKKLENEFTLQIPEDGVFSAMDYHIDWIYASLVIASKKHNNLLGLSPQNNDEQVIKAQQEDVDWLIAFDIGSTTHLILVEAKCVGSWDNSQVTSKLERLKQIFGDDGLNFPEIKPYFLLISPEEPQKLKIESAPKWSIHSDQKLHWMALEGMTDKILCVKRCDTNGKTSKDGGSWKVEERRRHRLPR